MLPDDQVAVDTDETCLGIATIDIIVPCNPVTYDVPEGLLDA